MAYVTGTASSLANLLAQIQNACVANGWTLSGNVLHKGTCYVDLRLGLNGEDGAPVDGNIIAQAGNGIDVANVLTDAVLRPPRFGPLRIASGTTYPDWDWPCSFYAHILTNPDEVYFFVKYDVSYWQHVAFGQSPSPGNAGTGNWVHATMPTIGRSDLYRRTNSIVMRPGGADIGSFYGALVAPAPFWWGTKENSWTVYLNSFIHGAISDATGLPIWSSDYVTIRDNAAEGISAATIAEPLLTGPNLWNGETTLVRIKVGQKRPSSKVSIIGELAHSRMCRNNYLDDGEIITLGTDKWKVYPCYRKDATAPDGNPGSGGVNHSGTVAIAVRYDGP